MAFTTGATGVVLPQPAGTVYPNHAGIPAPSIVDWFPTLTGGTYSNQDQAAWSVTGNDTYVVEAGEFPKVNGVAQQGLVRFATKPTAPAKVGMQADYSETALSYTATSNGGVTITLPKANWDADGLGVTYQIYRDGQPTSLAIQSVAGVPYTGTDNIGAEHVLEPSGDHVRGHEPAARHDVQVLRADDRCRRQCVRRATAALHRQLRDGADRVCVDDARLPNARPNIVGTNAITSRLGLRARQDSNLQPLDP